MSSVRSRGPTSEIDPAEVEPTPVAFGPDGIVEVTVAWGTTILQVFHLDPPRPFRVGTADDGACDFVLEAAGLAASGFPLVDIEGDTVLIATRRNPGECSGDRAEEPHRIALSYGGVAQVALGGLTFTVCRLSRDEPLARPLLPFDTEALSYIGLSLLAHAGALAAIAAFIPPLGLTASEDAFRDQIYLMSQYLEAAAEREHPPSDDNGASTEEAAPAGAAESAESASRASPRRGATRIADRPSPSAVRGGASLADSPNSRAEAAAEAGSFGTIAVLQGSQPIGGSAAPWEGALADAQGGGPNVAMWRSPSGELGGLSLGPIGGGDGGRGVDIGEIGTRCRGNPEDCLPGGMGPGGHGTGRLPRGHDSRAPTMRAGETIVNGHIPREIIQRIVRQNYGRFRLCYEQGMRENPSLHGRVNVKFVIGRDGTVMQAFDGGSDLPDPQVISCVIRAYYGLTFPAPESGIVAVSYPILFTNGD